jgi:hypothetical protein
VPYYYKVVLVGKTQTPVSCISHYCPAIMAPITINGNVWDPKVHVESSPSSNPTISSSAVPEEPDVAQSTVPLVEVSAALLREVAQLPTPKVATDAKSSNYILVQAKNDLSNDQKRELEGLGVKIHAYVDKKTYLCG